VSDNQKRGNVLDNARVEGMSFETFWVSRTSTRYSELGNNARSRNVCARTVRLLGIANRAICADNGKSVVNRRSPYRDRKPTPDIKPPPPVTEPPPPRVIEYLPMSTACVANYMAQTR
jgi:hypothetical protein